MVFVMFCPDQAVYAQRSSFRISLRLRLQVNADSVSPLGFFPLTGGGEEDHLRRGVSTDSFSTPVSASCKWEVHRLEFSQIHVPAGFTTHSCKCKPNSPAAFKSQSVLGAGYACNCERDCPVDLVSVCIHAHMCEYRSSNSLKAGNMHIVLCLRTRLLLAVQ